MSEIKGKLPASMLASLNAAKKSLDVRDPKKLEAAKMFENQFVRQMISEMRKTIPEDGLVPKSMGESIFSEQLDDQYADKWVDNGGIGLANVIYEQLQERYSGKKVAPAKGFSQEILPLKKPEIIGSKLKSNVENKAGSSDLFSQRDKDLFVLKRTNTGYHIKSREPLPENVDLKAPVAGKVIQAASLGEGKQMVILQHDEGLKMQFVHTGHNLVQTGDEIIAGQTIARLPASRQGELANVFFGLRKGITLE